MLFDEPLEDILFDRLYDLKRAVEVERGSDRAVSIMAAWAGVRPSTVYAWLQRKYTPADWKQLVRLLQRSTGEGFLQMAPLVISRQIHLGFLGEAIANGCLSDEMDMLCSIAGRLSQAHATGDYSECYSIANDLRRLGARVEREAEAPRGTVKPEPNET